VALVVGIQAVWRSARAARRRAFELSVYTAAQAEEMAVLAGHLNRNGFELANTSQRLFPKIRQWQTVLSSPLVLAAMPWALRRLFGRPLRRR
jgi:hypothetical protein